MLIFEFFERCVRYNEIIFGSEGKEFKPCFKKYLYSQVRSNFMEVPAEYWETAIFLPTEHFAKADKSSVFTISARGI